MRLRAIMVCGFLTLAVSGPAGAEGCWSLLESKFGPDVRKAVGDADPCKSLKVGFDVKQKFEITSLDICTHVNGVTLRTKANVSCRTGDGAFFKASVGGTLTGQMSLDIGACKVVSSDVQISGALGEILAGIPELQEAARLFAQSKLSEICFGKN
ncbi:hypothetical protein NKY44_26910 [Sinorhizobium meliloti]|uniref:hypothetical protein n=1 Tax=Rhizobium meliloti TaxID=382 RepID=UPI003D65DD49